MNETTMVCVCVLLYIERQSLSSAYVTTLTFNGSCPGDVTSQQQLMTSLSVELNRQSLCVFGDRLRDLCETSNYATCPGQQRQGRRAVRQTDESAASKFPLTISIVLYASRTYATHPASFITSLRWSLVTNQKGPYLTLLYLRGGQDTCPAPRPYQLGPMRVPECNNKVTGSGYKAVVDCEAETSTRALVTCSNLPTQVWSALSWLLASRF